jgi:hypothetical protein
MIIGKMMSKIKSIEYYLELFGSKESFTLKNAVEAFIYQYQEVNAIDFIPDRFRNEIVMLLDNELLISIAFHNYLRIDITRRFSYSGDYDI